MDIRFIKEPSTNYIARLADGRFLTCDWDTFPTTLNIAVNAYYDYDDTSPYYSYSGYFYTGTKVATSITDKVYSNGYLGYKKFSTGVATTTISNDDNNNTATLQWQLTSMGFTAYNTGNPWKFYWDIRLGLSLNYGSYSMLYFRKYMTSSCDASPLGVYTNPAGSMQYTSFSSLTIS